MCKKFGKNEESGKYNLCTDLRLLSASTSHEDLREGSNQQEIKCTSFRHFLAANNT